ncbi:MAG: DNA cytosine methyltransferase [Coriobacteriia bacterium]|nr:DNA cytosine methyltransferase [Coriobacteriia bacterium]
MKKRAYTALSLFSGAGGLDIGFEQAGFDILFANELDADAADTWMANRPDSHAMHQGDLNSYLNELSSYRDVDAVFGGPPCQGFSVAGKMNSEDPRNKLIWSFMEVINRVQPKVFIIENVRALGTLSKWQTVRQKIITRARQLGYYCDFAIYSASDYGVPQNRERVVFFGSRDFNSQEEFFALMATSRTRPKSLRKVLTETGGFGTDDNPQTCTAHVSLALKPVLRKSPYAGMLVNGAGRPINLDGVAQTLPASMGGNKTPIIDQAALENNTENWFVGYHRALLAGKTSPQKACIPKTIRRLTIKEAAALQTFPPAYKFCGKKTQQYKQIGNAVASSFACAIADTIAKTSL